jgi:flagellar biosynthesis protein FlhF
MIIKKFEASTAPKTMELVKKALGENAVIFSQKTLDKGTPYQRVEIMAATDYDMDKKTAPLLPEKELQGKSSPTYGYDAIRKPQKNPPQRQKKQLESQALAKNFAKLLKENTDPWESEKKRSTHAPLPKAIQRNQIKKWRDELIDQIQVEHLLSHSPGTPDIIALVGPTGVGKTTTAAKLAAWYHLHEGKKVTMISMDCYRIGATDQLRTYARIMRLPCEVAVRKDDLPAAVARHHDADLIIIDTAGKSPYDSKHVAELADWFAPVSNIQLLLCLSATTKKEDLSQIVNSYQPLAPHSVILTKLDETRAYASLCQQVAAANMPVGYLTMGQRVPEDFMVADKPFLDSFFKQGWPAMEQHMTN